MITRLRDFILRTYLRTPEHPMKYRIVQWLGRNWFPENGIIANAHPSLRLTLHPRDWIEYTLLQGKAYEPLTLEFLKQNLSAGNVAFMAGVNFGQHVAVAARAVGASGMIYGVEPQPRALVRAWDNIRLNGLEQQVRLVSAALGDADEMLPMTWSDPGNTGAASLLDAGIGLYVSVISTARLLATLSETKAIRLMLLDVQGFESIVLRGMKNGPLPEVFIVEVDPEFVHRSQTTEAEMIRQIGDLGYSLFNLAGVPVDPAKPVLPERNVVALRPGVTCTWVK